MLVIYFICIDSKEAAASDRKEKVEATNQVVNNFHSFHFRIRAILKLAESLTRAFLFIVPKENKNYTIILLAYPPVAFISGLL